MYATSVDADAEGASCWICLEEGPDESGQPLVRDCSCRGNAGFTHLSCIIEYAQQKSMGDVSDTIKFIEPWSKCPSCHQLYERELASNLSAACVKAVEEKYPECNWRHLSALHRQLGGFIHNIENPQQRDVYRKIGKKCITVAEQLKMKNEHLTMPNTILGIEADAHGILANLDMETGTDESIKRAVGYYGKARDICAVLGHTAQVAHVEAKIAEAKSMLRQEDNVEISDSELDSLRTVYELLVDKDGESSPGTITQGDHLSINLQKANHTIEAERLSKKLVAICRRVHGPNHKLTKNVQSTLELVARRLVMVPYENDVELFQALRYEDDGEKCVVKGPINTGSADTNEETILTVDTDDVYPTVGLPVVCHGLKNASYLNGKLGDVRGIDEKTGRFAVHFEDLTTKPKLVKYENLRVVFDLPDEVVEDYDGVD
mmetsp:Transcript_40665/g.85432  ORF Transcript_40665/g.85432 Transcript_40665/m.85432 type:complete len:433 (+) Transcript_40665:252-1550(+)|eukprot:CAMPEP_0183718184 /NCGR_PEP_ID=MMETSP0737-20130205/11514_1 /TAXON_ID=385413 /ORGANISM="Thalassiosira miniscula, Strain CCMP1093" /LENGTH=432 /DNA_ID=CAMNT_0025947703 /DNA_START=157 /DNA_END=1455 /DNA_ORIENTATION=+